MKGILNFIIGTLLPWFSLFAGLQPYPGIIGLNGRILLGAGIVSILAGLLFYIKGSKILHWFIIFSGIVLLLFTSWLLFGLWETYQKLLAEPLMVPKLGPGLFVATIGAVIMSVSMFTKFEKAPPNTSKLM